MITHIATGILITLFMLALFGLTIFVHELGHFVAAKCLGLVVDTFSIGFGPALVKKRVRGVLYKIGWIPLGGYVALPQLDPAAMESVQGSDDPSESGKRLLPSVAPWRKIVVSLAGAAGNIVLAIGLAWVIWANPGAVGGALNVIGHVDPDSPAYAAGLRPGQTIHRVNREPVGTWSEFLVESHLGAVDDSIDLTVSGPEVGIVPVTVRAPITNLTADVRGVAGITPVLECVIANVMPASPAAESGLEPQDIVTELDGVPVVGSRHFVTLIETIGERSVRLTLTRNGETHTVTLTPRMHAEYGRPMIGVELADLQRGTPMWMQYRAPSKQLAHDAKGIFRILRALVAPRTRGETGRAAGALGGPLMIMATLWLSVRTGLLGSIGFMRFLNVNLAILNLLPIPVLDGGHILFSVWEMVFRRKPNARVVNWLVNIFAILLIGAVLLITRNDVMRLWRDFRGAANSGETDSALDRDSEPTNHP